MSTRGIVPLEPCAVAALTSLLVACGSVSAPATGTMDIVVLGEPALPPGLTGLAVIIDGVPHTLTIDVAGARFRLEPVSAGEHTVVLDGVPANCTDTTGKRTVTVAASRTTKIEFTLACALEKTALRIFVQTTGVSLDPDGYRIHVVGWSLDIFVDAPVNGDVIVREGFAIAGQYDVSIGDVAGNCSVEGPATRSVSIPSWRTTEVSFSVVCHPPPRNALQVTATTTGVALDPDGYTVRVVGPYEYYDETLAIPTNGAVTFENLFGGTYTAAIDGVAANCTRPGPLTFLYPEVRSVAFTIVCSSAPRRD